MDLLCRAAAGGQADGRTSPDLQFSSAAPIALVGGLARAWTAMKPTRICNWPPRLDVALRHPPRRCGSPRVRARRVQPVHPLLLAVARARWAGRPAKQRHFEKLGGVHIMVA
jgi:hypothetical protein